MKYFLSLIVMSTIAFTSMTCHSPTGPSNGSDTTSHAWNFTVYTFGDGGSSDLYDVAVINDTLAYAVGEIYLKDSTGQLEYLPHNFAVWDGRHWGMKKISVSFRGNNITTPIEGICGLSPDDIWLIAGDPIHGDGNNWIDYDIRAILGDNQLELSKAWAASPSSIYFVGRSGSVLLYSGNNFRKINATTSLNFYDVYGSNGQILDVASNPFTGYDRKIMQLNGTTATAISDSPITWPLMGVWFVPGHYYVVGQGIYEKTSLSDPVWRQDSIDTVDFFSCIRGNAWNDFFVAGGYGQLLHFNGNSWQSYQSVLGLQSGSIGRIAVKGNMMMLVGMLGSKAIAVIGRR
jgi:hypothetical protein